MTKYHDYSLAVYWTGNKGTGTTHYKDYDRSYTISCNHKPDILGSSDPAFRGDSLKYNPEELLVASASSCHMLWYLHLCAVEKVVVTNYTDHTKGVMEELSSGSGSFKEIILNPHVKVTNIAMKEKAIELHHKAHEYCFIANSVNFPIHCIPIIEIDSL